MLRRWVTHTVTPPGGVTARDNRWLIFVFSVVILGFVPAWAQDAKGTDSSVTLPDGSVYEGGLQDGKFNGQGRMDYADGRQYTGEFKDGLFDGRGVLVYTDGSKYEGQFKEGLLNGQGILTYSDGSTYKGQFKNGQFNGQGDLAIFGGDRYLGKFKDGEMDGAVAVDSSGKPIPKKVTDTPA